MSALTDLQDAIQAIEGQTKAAKTALSAEIVTYIAAVKALTAGLIASAAEVNVMTAVTPGTAPANLCAVLGTNKQLDEFHTAALYLAGYHDPPGDAGTLITATAAHLNRLASAAAGVSSASKALVLGPTKNTDILGLPIGGLKIGVAGAEVVITPTAAELNVLAGIAATLTADELSLLDGCTCTAAELNLSDDRPYSIVMTHAPGGANVCTVTVNVLDAAGSAIDTPVFFDFWLSDSSNGVGLAAVPPDSVSDGGAGNIWHVDTAACAIRCQTDATGVSVLSISDASKSTFYLCAALRTNGRPQVHAVPIGTVDYT
jgi:hypothetical protein